jgi:hypothetical protein
LRELLAAPDIRQRLDHYPVRDRRVGLVRLADVARITGDRAGSGRLVEEAHALSSGAPPTTFVRRQLALAAIRAGHIDLAERIGVRELGDLAAPERPGLAAPSLIETAQRLLIDNDRLVETATRVPGPVDQPLGTPPQALRPTVRTEHPTLDVFLRAEGDGIVVHAQPPGGRAPHRARIGVGDNPVVRAVVHAVRRPGTLDAQLAELFTDRAIAGPGLFALLLGGKSSDLLGDEPVDIRLWTEGAPLAMIPWELAAGDGGNALLTSDPRVRHLYRGFLDAAEEPAPPGPGQPTVLVIRAKVRDRHKAPGMIKTTLMPIESQYAASGMRVFITESVNLESLVNLVSKHSPDIVHIKAGFVDAGGGAAADISSGVAGQVRLAGIDQDRLTTTGFATAVAAAAGARPVILLDPPAVSHVSVQAVQLLLRNAFAAEVAAIVAVPAVIATGLVRYGCQDALYRRLPRDLAAGHRMADVVDGIRALAGDVPDTEDSFGFLPAALFAARPQHRVVTGP